MPKVCGFSVETIVPNMSFSAVISLATEVPGPGAYDPQGLSYDASVLRTMLRRTTDPDYEAYKRGAFLEKTNRFNKDKPSDVPGPLNRVAFSPLHT